MHAATHAAPPRLRVAREGAGAICAVPRSRKDRELTVIRSHARPGAWVITLAVLAVGAFVSAPTASAVVSHTVAGSTAKAKRIQQFWTPKRMRQAKPLPLPRTAPPSPSSSRSDSSAAPTGKPRTIPPSLPKGDSGSASPRAAIVQNPGRVSVLNSGQAVRQGPQRHVLVLRDGRRHPPSNRVAGRALRPRERCLGVEGDIRSCLQERPRAVRQLRGVELVRAQPVVRPRGRELRLLGDGSLPAGGERRWGAGDGVELPGKPALYLLRLSRFVPVQRRESV